MSTYQCDSSTTPTTFCLFCNKVLTKTGVKYCNGTCRAKHVNSTRTIKTGAQKTTSCVTCGSLIQCSVRVSNTKAKCDYCKKRRKQSISLLPKTDVGRNVYSSGLYPRKSINLKKLGFDFSGDVDVEAAKLKELLEHEYFSNSESMLSIMTKYNIPSSKTIHHIFSILGITSRTLSEGAKLSILQSRKQNSDTTNKGFWHNTWENTPVFLRSSYELEFAKILDEKHIKYKVEEKRVKYFDANKQLTRIAIPDFFLPDTNSIVEVKANYWYDESNMISKRKAYRECGYNFFLYLDHILYH